MVEVCTGKLEGVLSQHVMSAQFNSKCFSKFYPFFNVSWFIVIILNYYYCYYYTTLTLFFSLQITSVSHSVHFLL